jgi:hypothetical protein
MLKKFFLYKLNKTVKYTFFPGILLPKSHFYECVEKINVIFKKTDLTKSTHKDYSLLNALEKCAVYAKR